MQNCQRKLLLQTKLNTNEFVIDKNSNPKSGNHVLYISYGELNKIKHRTK